MRIFFCFRTLEKFHIKKSKTLLKLLLLLFIRKDVFKDDFHILSTKESFMQILDRSFLHKLFYHLYTLSYM